MFRKLLFLSAVFAIFNIVSCKNYGDETILAGTKVKSLSESTITLSDGQIFDIAQAGSSAYTTLVLVRHAEKKTNEQDPKLTSAGQKRAEDLKDILLPLNPDRIYTTTYKRTVSTVLPLAKAIKKPNYHYDAKKYYDLFDKIFKDHKPEKAVIVGHSNTIPEMLNLLAGEKLYDEFDEKEYSRLFLVQTKGLGESEITELKY